LADRGIVPDVERTSGRGHAEELARLAVDAGRRYLIAVGGDGTVHEVVNGMVDADTGTVLGDDPVLAVVGAGSGSDLVRTFGLDRAPERLVDHLVSDDILRLDVGRVRCVGRDGTPRTRLFANAEVIEQRPPATNIAESALKTSTISKIAVEINLSARVSIKGT
jgi:diacylglycerol kinase family enzyme